ncbi:NUDIX domain-containing protein [Streptomyces sp. NPDC093595]|uniref:NUDIX hydrolase n=1 Tax=Streptomyces sp. NPDC093595 TaxID=3366045 RepID=UPI0037F9CF8A
MHGPDGVLLGRHRRRTWDLAGRTVEPGESFAQAAVRELREEAGLAADPGDVRVRGTLLDRVGDVVRVAVPVVGTRWSGVAEQREEAIVLAVLAPGRAAWPAVRAERPVPDRLEPESAARPSAHPLPRLPLSRPCLAGAHAPPRSTGRHHRDPAPYRCPPPVPSGRLRPP